MMASVTLSVPKDLKNQLKAFSWINWSEIAREEATKKLIFEDYIKAGKISDDDLEFCEKMDWHPADELPLREDFIERMKAVKKEKSIKARSVSDILR
ncbi:MAG: hypothetical protein V1702_00560 [Candidatus Woesearchaeota archaeon]